MKSKVTIAAALAVAFVTGFFVGQLQFKASVDN